MARLPLLFLLMAFAFSNCQVMAQQGSFGGGGGSSGRTAFGSNSGMGQGGQGQGGFTSEIPTFGLTSEGARFDREARPAGTFVGADSTEMSSRPTGFVGVMGGNFLNSQTSSSGGGIGGLGGMGSGGLGGRSGSAFGSGVNSARGMTGSRGSSMFGGASSARTGGRGGRTGSLGGGNLGGNTFGGNTFGGNTFGGNNFGGTGNLGGQRSGGLGVGTGSFGGSNLGGSNLTGQLGNTGRTGTGNRNSNTGFGQGQTGMIGNRSTAEQTINYQTNLKVRFQQPQPAVVASAIVSNLQTRLNVSSRIRKTGNITVGVRNRTARLTGTVVSERDRQLALGLALLEPGVSAVEDELVVAEQAESLPSPPLSDSLNSSVPST